MKTITEHIRTLNIPYYNNMEGLGAVCKNLQQYGDIGMPISGSIFLSELSYGLIDNLAFGYNGNQLKYIDDSAPEIYFANSTDFKDYAHEETEYAYNENGAMIKDLNICNP
jgi:hypothetical protein